MGTIGVIPIPPAIKIERCAPPSEREVIARCRYVQLYSGGRKQLQSPPLSRPFPAGSSWIGDFILLVVPKITIQRVLADFSARQMKIYVRPWCVVRQFCVVCCDQRDRINPIGQ